MKIIKKKYCVFLLILLNSCDLFNGGCGCVSFYRLELIIGLREIKDSRVKSIKVTLKNLDGIKPEFYVSKGVGTIIRSLEKKAGIYVTEQKRDKYVHRGETYYFKYVNVIFEPPWKQRWDFTLGKKRIYELKTYINDKLFFTKKISFTPEDKKGDLIHTDEVEVDNMDYVKEINKDDWVIELTDTDIKDKL